MSVESQFDEWLPSRLPGLNGIEETTLPILAGSLDLTIGPKKPQKSGLDYRPSLSFRSFADKNILLIPRNALVPLVDHLR